MSDLISRIKVISVLEQLEEHSLTGKMDISNAIYLLNNQPTAYSVDKVVEELEKLQDKAVSVKNDDISMYATGMMSKAIEIVKQGGVDDGVCEWEPHRNNYVTSCEEDFVPMMRGYKYCPYCGKKIKVVD